MSRRNTYKLSILVRSPYNSIIYIENELALLACFVFRGSGEAGREAQGSFRPLRTTAGPALARLRIGGSREGGGQGGQEGGIAGDDPPHLHQ